MSNQIMDLAKNYQFSANEVLEKIKSLKSMKNEDNIAKCKQEIAMANVRLICKVMKPYLKFKTLSSDDMISEGVLGIYAAIDKFDVTKNIQFSTYAFFWIKQKIQRYVEKNCMNRLDKSSQSIDRPYFSADEGKTLGDMIMSNDVVDVKSETSEMLESLISTLKPREQFVLKARFGIR